MSTHAQRAQARKRTEETLASAGRWLAANAGLFIPDAGRCASCAGDGSAGVDVVVHADKTGVFTVRHTVTYASSPPIERWLGDENG